MKAADFGRYIGKTYQKIDRLLDFLPALPRKATAASILLLGLPIIATGFFFLVRVPAPIPEPRTNAYIQETLEVDMLSDELEKTEEEIIAEELKDVECIYRPFTDAFGIVVSSQEDIPVWARRIGI